MTLQDWTDGDVLSAAPLEKGIREIGRIISYPTITGNNDVNVTFTSDSATTSTGFIYDSTYDNYVGTGTCTLIGPSTASYSYDVITEGFLKWKYKINTIVDECNDSSVDATIWDSSQSTALSVSASEDADKLTIEADGTDTFSKWLYLDTKISTLGDFDGDNVNVSFKIDAGGNGNAIWTYKVSLFDGTNTVDLYTSYGEASLSKTATFRYDSVNQVAYVGTSEVDCSSLSGRVSLRFSKQCNSSATEDYLNVYYVRKEMGNETTIITETYSSDNGNNYETHTNGYVSFSTNPGTLVVPKLTSSVVSGELLLVYGAYGVLFNNLS